jgi:urease accessory protein
MVAVLTDPSERSGWQAQLHLGFAAQGGCTQLVERRHVGPLRVQRPFYPEGPAVCHVYLLHPPGGVVGGDTLEIEVQAAAGAHAFITTPAAGKFYRCEGRTGTLHQHLRIAAGACIEWLPQETLVYAGAQAAMSTRVEIAPGGSFIGGEILCLGRPASGERFPHGALRQGFEIWRDGRPLWIERAGYEGDAAALSAAWGLQDFPVVATLVCVGGDAALTEAIRAAVAPDADERFAVTRLREVTVCRYLGPSAERARRCLVPAWWQMRWALLRRGPHRPRIWET